MKRNNDLLQLPGLVDVHVHLREPGATQKEDFESGTRAAVAGGYTQILDMPNNIPPIVTPEDLEDKIKLARGRIWCDLGFNFGATAESVKYFRKISQKALIFKSWKSDLPIMVHAEGETVKVAISLAKKYQKAIHVCHVTDDQIKAIEVAKRRGVKITSEVCPHHLFLTKEDVKKLGPLAMMKPPLLSKKGQKRLWENLENIDIISTDHAPHTLDEKYDKSSPKFGVPGLETTLPLMLAAVSKDLLSIKRLVEMTNINPRKIFRLPTQLNTFVTVNLNKRFKISNKGLFTKCGWTPFVGLEGRGEIKKVVLRGQTIFENGIFVGKPQGKVICPD